MKTSPVDILTDILILKGKNKSPDQSLSREIKQLKKSVSRAHMFSVPWKYDFTHHCKRCNSTYHLQRHHITYNPELTVFLCYKCHKIITEANRMAAFIAGTNLKEREKYTNKVRVIVWKYFLSPEFQLDTTQIRKEIMRQLRRVDIEQRWGTTQTHTSTLAGSSAYC